MEISEARLKLSEVANRVAFGKERVTITRHGKALVALVPLEDGRLLEELEGRIDLEGGARRPRRGNGPGDRAVGAGEGRARLVESRRGLQHDVWKLPTSIHRHHPYCHSGRLPSFHQRGCQPSPAGGVSARIAGSSAASAG
jgi:prevent-host-death family protein